MSNALTTQGLIRKQKRFELAVETDWTTMDHTDCEGVAGHGTSYMYREDTAAVRNIC